MSSPIDFDLFDIEFDVSDFENPAYTFDDFKSEHPEYLSALNNYITLIYNTYILVHNKRFIKIKKCPQNFEIARKCGFGMLMRHAMETIVTSIATESGIEVGGRSVFERLTALKGQKIEIYDSNKQRVLLKLLDLTNEIAHPHVIHENQASFEELEKFYNESFKSVLCDHLSYLDETIRKSRSFDFGITREVAKGRKQAFKYLQTIKNQLDNLNIFEKSTNILIQGCLVRQLTECATNLWAYNYGIVPTDASTFENQINLGKVLDILVKISRSSKKNAFGTSALTSQVIDNLYTLKNASNSLMHVEKFASGNLKAQGDELLKLYNIVKTECSPHTMKKKLSDAKAIGNVPRKKPRTISPTVTAVLCGTLGWFGAHHFYAGNFIKGIIYIPFLGFIVGPLLDLQKISKGRFRNGRGFRIGRSALASFIASIFILGHLFLLYTVGTKLYHSDFLEKVKQFPLLNSVIIQKSDNEILSSMEQISVGFCSATSTLHTDKGVMEGALCVDGKSSTCWQEGADGKGIGETLKFSFEGKQSFNAISIQNGNQGSKEAYYNNARASKLLIKIGSSFQIVQLEDSMEKQTFLLPEERVSSDIRIMVLSAYEGYQWEDLCISEVEFYKETEQNG